MIDIYIPNSFYTIPNSFYTRLAKIWFKNWGEDEITNHHQLKRFFEDITLGFLFGDESIIYQGQSDKVINLMKEYGIIHKTWLISDGKQSAKLRRICLN